MISLAEKKVIVVGLGKSGLAAAELLCRPGARVTAVDGSDTPAMKEAAGRLREMGAEVQLGSSGVPEGNFDFVVTSPGVPWTNPVLVEMKARKVPIIGELELGYQQARCLNVAITGT